MTRSRNGGHLHPPPRKWGRGTALRSRVVEGASDSTLRFRRKSFVAARAPSTMLRMVPLPRYRGCGQAISFSRCIFLIRTRAMRKPFPRTSPHIDLRQIDPAVEGRIHHGRARHGRKERKRKKGSRTPKGANAATALARCGARPAGRARLPAFHCGSCQGDSWSPRLSVRPCFLRLGRSIRSCTAAPTGGRRPRASPRALPAPSCLRPASTSRAGHNAGRMMPEPPGSKGDEPLPAGTATRSAGRGHRPASL